MEDNSQDSLIEFPCDFHIKVIGIMSDTFSDSVINIIKQTDSTFNSSKIEMKPSQNKTYISLTCSVYVNNKKELDHIYSQLSTHPDSRFVI
jgi:putative lipoic acid-binding regulatory protein